MGSAASQARAGSFISKLAFHLAKVTASQHHLAMPLSVTDLSKPVKLGAARTLAASLSRCGSDSWLKLWKLGVRSDMGLGLSLCAVPLLQFGSQRLEEVGLEHRSKVVAQTVIKTVNDEEGTNLRRRGREGFIPNRQEDVEHDEESIKVDRSQSKSTWVGLSRYLK